MEKLNKYGKLSGGYIFDTLDRIAHKKAIEYIGESVTANAEIKYFSELPETTILEELADTIILTSSGSSVTMMFLNSFFFASFTFVKRKNG